MSNTQKKKVSVSLRANHRLFRTNVNGAHVNTKVYIHDRETKNANRNQPPVRLTPNQVANRIRKTPTNKEFYFTTNNKGELKNIYRKDQLTENQRRNLPSGSLNMIFNFFDR